MCWKLDNLGSLLQDYCKEGDSGLAQSMELEGML